MNLALLLLAAAGVSSQMNLNRRTGSPVVVVAAAVVLVDQLLHLTRPIPFDQMHHRAGPFGWTDCPIAAVGQAAAVALSWGWRRTDCPLDSSFDCCPSLGSGPFDQTGQTDFELVLVLLVTLLKQYN